MIEYITLTKIKELTIGNVIFQNVSQAVAPSILAAQTYWPILSEVKENDYLNTLAIAISYTRN